MLVQSWVDVLVGSLQGLYIQVISFLPSLLGALVIFVIGLVVAYGLEKLVEQIIYHLKLDSFLKRLGLGVYFERANLELNAGHFFGKLVYWFILVAFLLASSDILGFFALSDFLKQVLAYIPNVVIAAMILLASFVVAKFLRGLVRASVLSARLHAAKSLGTVAWWGVIVFGFLSALIELGVAVPIIQTLITGLVAMLALAGGLAFGLGGREQAANFLEKVHEEIHHKE